MKPSFASSEGEESSSEESEEQPEEDDLNPPPEKEPSEPPPAPKSEPADETTADIGKSIRTPPSSMIEDEIDLLEKALEVPGAASSQAELLEKRAVVSGESSRSDSIEERAVVSGELLSRRQAEGGSIYDILKARGVEAPLVPGANVLPNGAVVMVGAVTSFDVRDVTSECVRELAGSAGQLRAAAEAAQKFLGSQTLKNLEEVEMKISELLAKPCGKSLDVTFETLSPWKPRLQLQKEKEEEATAAEERAKFLRLSAEREAKTISLSLNAIIPSMVARLESWASIAPP